MARILVIDDDPDTRELLEQMLKGAGHQVSLAADGSEGVKQFCANPADLVITDLYMPGQEGIETIIQLRRQNPTAAILAISGKAGAEPMLFVARKLGAIETLHKPFVAEELLASVERALRKDKAVLVQPLRPPPSDIP